LMLDGNKWED
ncbi:hypothetical protein D043_0353B, partial [Vibrio parahaemolyticus EKP-021]